MRHFVTADVASVAVVVVAYRHSCLSVTSLPTSAHPPANLPPSRSVSTHEKCVLIAKMPSLAALRFDAN